jgi:hypothetical protein
MDAINLIPGMIFTYGLGVIMYGLPAFWIAEWVGTRRFQPWAFRTGFQVVRETRSLPRPRGLSDPSLSQRADVSKSLLRSFACFIFIF